MNKLIELSTYYPQRHRGQNNPLFLNFSFNFDLQEHALMTNKQEHIHFIAIGGSLMHNLALALHHQGKNVTGSDDEIFEPSRSKLQSAGLLPEEEGWFPDRISENLSAVIVGMHARKDNPELARARELNLPVYSFPEYIYLQSVNKQRIVITGSHGKSTITAMIMHVLNKLDRPFDYAIGAEVEGFDTMVRLTDAPVIIIEGDEYHTSPEESTPKFMHYHHHIGLISGIEWDHVNVFPTEEGYVNEFKKFADATPKAGSLVYNEEDDRVKAICSQERDDVLTLAYSTPKFEVKDNTTVLSRLEGDVPLEIFGRHNLLNMMGAKTVLNRIGVQDNDFYQAIQSFRGAGKRLQKIESGNGLTIFRDYAHAPSKVRATVNAVREQFTDRRLVACLELHTFSSLTKSFLPNYRNSMEGADTRIVYFNPATVTHKKLPGITADDIKTAFEDSELQVFTSKEDMLAYLKETVSPDAVLLLMSSGTFDRLDIGQVTSLIQE